MRFCSSCGSRFTNDARYCPVDGQPTTDLPEDAPKVDPLIGALIDGRYRVEKPIGEGGMGVVYLATHAALQKKFALKVLRGEMARDQDVVQRFVQEAQASSSIGHANIIDISDFGRLPDGSFYFVMEFLDGQSLTDLVSHAGAMTLDVAVPIIEQMASALSAAHDRGIVHRDLKPDNIFLVKRGQNPHFVKILDFGIAKVGGAASKLTRTGMIFGTPHYMSPEQAAGQAVDKRTDIYALGVIMYEMVTGRVPFDADTFMGILSKHMFEQPVPPTDLLSSKDLGVLEPVILRALVKKPEQRYQAMGELLRDLMTLKAGGRVALPVDSSAATSATPHAPAFTPASAPVLANAPTPRTAARSLSVVTPKTLAIGAAALLTLGCAVGVSAYLLHHFSELASSEAAESPVSRGSGAPAMPTMPTMPSMPGMPGAAAPGGTGASPTAALPVGAAPPARTTTIRLESDPAGASVFQGDSIVGTTPFELPRPAATQQLVLRLPEHRDYSLTLEPTSESPVFAALTRGGVSASRAETGSSSATGSGAEARVATAPRTTTPRVTTPRATTPNVTPPPTMDTTPVERAPRPPPDVLDPWQ